MSLVSKFKSSRCRSFNNRTVAIMQSCTTSICHSICATKLCAHSHSSQRVLSGGAKSVWACLSTGAGNSQCGR